MGVAVASFVFVEVGVVALEGGVLDDSTVEDVVEVAAEAQSHCCTDAPILMCITRSNPTQSHLLYTKYVNSSIP